MIRLFVDAPLAANVACDASENQTHYLRHVMRVKIGDAVLLFNGLDGEWQAEIAEISKRGVQLLPLKQTRKQHAPADLWLCFAPVKNVRLDFMVQKAVELGVSRLQPVITRRTVAKNLRLDKMRLNAIEAAEQCERLDVPECAEPVKLNELLQQWNEHAGAERLLIHCDETGAGEPILKAFEALKAKPAAKAAILIGPEGGFAPEELVMLSAHETALPVSLGPRILRADTAAIAALSCWQAACGDWHERPHFDKEAL